MAGANYTYGPHCEGLNWSAHGLRSALHSHTCTPKIQLSPGQRGAPNTQLTHGAVGTAKRVDGLRSSLLVMTNPILYLGIPCALQGEEK